MASGMLCHLFRGAHHHDLAALITAIRSKINDPVGTADHIEVVLDYEDRIALIHQALHHINQLAYIKKTQAGSGLVDWVEGLAGGPLGEFVAQLHGAKTTPQPSNKTPQRRGKGLRPR